MLQNASRRRAVPRADGDLDVALEIADDVRADISERWINAVVEVVIPTDVSLDATHEEKVEAALAQLDRMVLPDDAVASIRYELVEDGEPV